MKVVASAPGKIVMCGEYAVLFGAPAVCMAVDRRAIVTVTSSPDDQCHVTTPGLAGGDPFAVIDAVCGGKRPPLSIELDTRAFASAGKKIGIGSSAALITALQAALRASADVLDDAMRAHARFQSGSGSGIDIAAAVHGGLIQYQMAPRSIRQVAWPKGLEMRVIWTGVPASTEAQLKKLAEQTMKPSQAALSDAAESMARTWQFGEVDRLMIDYVSYVDVLRQFSVDHDLGIFDAGHDELTNLAMDHDLVYKPAGAGGGDIGILLGRDGADLDAFISRQRDLIRGVVPCAPDPDGARLEPV